MEVCLVDFVEGGDEQDQCNQADRSGAVCKHAHMAVYIWSVNAVKGYRGSVDSLGTLTSIAVQSCQPCRAVCNSMPMTVCQVDHAKSLHDRK
eukprot:1160023-Pelagomonas_calceolata.AAC.3